MRVASVGALAALVLAVAAPARATEGADCLLEWRVPGAAPERAGVRARCRDGDSSCDADGTADGTCTFATVLCLNAEGCEPGRVERVRVRGWRKRSIVQALSALDYPLEAAACTDPVLLRLRVRQRATVTATVRDGRTRRADRDRLRLACDPAPQAAGRAVIVTTNFETGQLATVGVTPPHPLRHLGEPIHSDAVVRTAGGHVYVINRFFADNVQVLDPARGFRTVLQCSTGPGSNPHDIALVDAHKAYVTRYGERALWIVDPSAPFSCRGFRRGAIDLSAFAAANAGGVPDMDQMALVAGRLFVSVQRLDRQFAPTDNSQLVVIDTATDTILGAIVLSGRNAFGDASRLAQEPGTGKLLVSEAGNIYRTGDGGIERVDPFAPFDRAAEGFLITEAELGGNVTDFVIVSPTKGYAIIQTDALRNVLVAFDPSQRVVTGRLLSRTEYLPDIALAPDGTLWVADQTLPTPGIRIFDTTTDAQLTRGTIATGLPPFSMAFLP
jgi:DNA-binding beta-propeller fold protein YncE